ncbi:MAG: thermonuclease family protein [Candidatus Omnitrophota bacterium]|jgi:micrococcal nuclease
MKIKAAFVLGLVFVSQVILSLDLCQASDSFTVTGVIDGETIRLFDGEKVRLIGIDVPASFQNVKLCEDIRNTGKDALTLMTVGKNAGQFLRELIGNETVVLEYDAVEKEKSGRQWAYVYFYLDPHLNMEIPEKWYTELSPGTGERQLRVFLNATMIRAGYAQMKIIPPNVKYQELFSKLQEEAKEQKRGLWGPSAPSADPQ